MRNILPNKVYLKNRERGLVFSVLENMRSFLYALNDVLFVGGKLEGSAVSFAEWSQSFSGSFQVGLL